MQVDRNLHHELQLNQTQNRPLFTFGIKWKTRDINCQYFFIILRRMVKEKIRFVDLFAGIGGFHLAITNVFPNAECVWASEKDYVTAQVYEENFGVNAYNDITKFDEKQIPKFNLLCAGFPCQPFSKGGDQKGFDDIRGTLFFDIVRILKYHKPKYILLENVANLINHDDGNTYRVILKSLKELGYVLPENPIKISPDELGLPIQRPRVFLPGILTNKAKSINVVLPQKVTKIPNHISRNFKAGSLPVFPI